MCSSVGTTPGLIIRPMRQYERTTPVICRQARATQPGSPPGERSIMPASPEPAAPAATLARLLDALGSGLIEVISAPRGLQLAVAEPVIFDPVAGQIATTDDLVLAVGVDATTPLALDAVEAARRAGACAVIMKTGGQVPGLLARAADAAGVALLEIPVATSWAQLLTLLRTARGAIGRPYGTAGPGLQVGDLFGLANAIAATVGGATTIEDLQSNVLAYSSLEQPTDQPRRDTILGRRVPSGWSRELVDRGVWRELYRSSDVVAVHGLRVPVSGGDHADLEPRLAIMIRAGGEPLGSIWVMQGDQQLTGTAADALRSAAEIAAMHLLHHREGADLDRRQRAELLRTLLEGGRAGPAIATLRLSHGTPLTVLGFTPDLDEPEDAAELALQRVAGLITLHIEAYRQHAHTVCIDDVVYVLLSSPDVTDRQKVRGIAAELGDRAEQGAKVPVRAGIGAAVPDVTGLPSSRRD